MRVTERRVDHGRLFEFDPPFVLCGQGFNNSEAGTVRSIFVADHPGDSQVHVSTLIRGGFDHRVEAVQ